MHFRRSRRATEVTLHIPQPQQWTGLLARSYGACAYRAGSRGSNWRLRLAIECRSFGKVGPFYGVGLRNASAECACGMRPRNAFPESRDGRAARQFPDTSAAREPCEVADDVAAACFECTCFRLGDSGMALGYSNSGLISAYGLAGHAEKDAYFLWNETSTRELRGVRAVRQSVSGAGAGFS